MSSITTKVPAARGLAALAAGASLAALPASASAHGAHGGGRDAQVRISSRVADRASRAERDVTRAGDAIDDGNATTAASDLKAARTSLASAQKTAIKHVVAGDDAGPAYAEAILATDDKIASGAADLFDGQDGDTVTALADTVKAADDSRDAVVAAITALGADDQADYADVADAAGQDVASELSDIADALSDDTLTDAATAALTAAQTQLKATQTALTALAGNDDTSDGADYLGTSSTSGDTSQSSGRGGCPHGGGQQGQTSGSGTGTGSGSDYLS
ncbi:MAG TPA: hypothetical protein VI318_23795 [Baekduia sp.]